jgi:hypothetical protein
MQGLLHTTTIQRGASACGPAQAAMAIGKQQLRVVVGLPESAQDAQGDLGQWHKAVPIAFGVANVDPVAHGIDVGNLKGQSFAQTKAHAVHGEIEHPVAQRAGL